METKKSEERTLSLRLKPIFTLDRDKRLGTQIGDTNVYLHKDKAICNCPFRAALIKEGWLGIACGTDCHHFHLIPETKKTTVPTNPDAQVTEVKEQIVETGKILVKLTCGSGTNGNGVYYPIANMDMKGGVEKQTESPLKVVKSISEQQSST